jgi:hypothetical protein
LNNAVWRGEFSHEAPIFARESAAIDRIEFISDSATPPIGAARSRRAAWTYGNYNAGHFHVSECRISMEPCMNDQCPLQRVPNTTGIDTKMIELLEHPFFIVGQRLVSSDWHFMCRAARQFNDPFVLK